MAGQHVGTPCRAQGRWYHLLVPISRGFIHHEVQAAPMAPREEDFWRLDLPSDKPGHRWKMLEDLRALSLGSHYARLGNILNLASCHFRALGADVTDNRVAE